MKLINSSVPFASYEGDLVTWNLIDLGPFENKPIVYDVEALTSGKFVNSFWVEIFSDDGSVAQPIYASSAIDVGEFEDERDLPGWQRQSLRCDMWTVNEGSVKVHLSFFEVLFSFDVSLLAQF